MSRSLHLFRTVLSPRAVTLIAFSVSALPALAAGAPAQKLDFNRDIRPILADTCFACHGFDEKARKAKLRLDVADEAYRERDGSTPIKPGNLGKSEVWARIISTDPDEVMPPPKSHRVIKDSEKELIKRWIEEGAPYAGHWSFIPPKKIPLPAPGANPVDAFVREQLAKEGLDPSPEADRYSLIRRLSLGLTGLPPNAAEVDAFVRDGSPNAYEAVVDRLLRSPHFGERLALDWLDAARYADTNGFSIDGGRHMWLWRDWVINAFNTNKPYDEFLIEQVAGDLLPNPTQGQIIATGFQRNNMVTHEGGTIPEENLTNYNVDRVRTLGESVLGLTLGCAQCHNHKYDPITQKDFYSLFAYFNTLSDRGLDGNGGVNPAPYMQAKTVLHTGEERQLPKQIAALEARLATPPAKILAAWEQQQRTELSHRGNALQILPLKVLKISTPNRGAGFEIEDQRFVHVTQPNGLAAYDVLTDLPKSSKPITGLRVVFHPDPSTPGQGWGYGPQAGRAGRKQGEPPKKGSFVLTALSTSVGEVPADQVDLYRLLGVRRVTASTWKPDHRPENCLDMRNDNGWAPPDSAMGPVHLTITFDQPVDSSVTPFLTTQLNFGAGDNLIAARMELFAITGNDDGSTLAPEVIAALNIAAGQRTPEQTKVIHEAFAALSPQMARVRTDLANLKERLAVLTQEFPTMVMDVAAKPRDTFVLNRGDYLQPTVKVAMATPDALPKASGSQDGRLALARWITMPNHPLTARVYVNRLWQMLFGAGIVRTPADFGAQGEWPTHPALLDWLAVDFQQSGWNIKALVKKIVMSDTFRQSSATSAGLLERDPQNRLLARGPRYRLAGEIVRDSALKVSGLLVSRIGGPSVNPYTPGDLWREISHYGSTPATAQTFVQDHGEKLYRRSLYTFWKRTAPPPNMAAFDAPNRETCVVSRPATNTPLQALVMLNDTQFIEAARVFAQRILAQPNLRDDTARIRWAVLEALSRPATEQELNVLSAALERERKRYQADAKAAIELLAVGESARDRRVPAAEHAAWTQVASTILNLNECVTCN